MMPFMRNLGFVALAFGACSVHAMPRAPDESPIFRAIDRGDLKRVRAALKSPDQLYARDERGRTALARATAAGNTAIIDLFLARKPDIDGRDLNGETALHIAARASDPTLVKRLLAAAANPRLYNRRCEAPADVAAGFGAPEVYAILRAATFKQPFPDDGTVDECQLNAEPKTMHAASVAFYKRRFSITHAEDYYYAAEALGFLASHKVAAADLATELPSLLAAFLDQDLPADGDQEEIESTAAAVRGQVRVLASRVKWTPAGAAAFDRALLAIVQKGPDRPGFGAALATIGRDRDGKARALKTLKDLQAKGAIEPGEFRRFKSRYLK